MAEQLSNRKFERLSQPDFSQDYENLEVPVFQPFSDSHDTRLQNCINQFFTDITRPLQLNALMEEELLVYEEEENLESIQRTLSLRDFQILATVTSIKHEGMYHTAADKIPLAAATIVAIKGYHEGDNFLTDILFRR